MTSNNFLSRNLNAKNCKLVQNVEVFLVVVGARAHRWSFNQDATSNQKQKKYALQME